MDVSAAASAQAGAWPTTGKTPLFFAAATASLLGMIAVADVVKPPSAAAPLRELQRHGHPTS